MPLLPALRRRRRSACSPTRCSALLPAGDGRARPARRRGAARRRRREAMRLNLRQPAGAARAGAASPRRRTATRTTSTTLRARRRLGATGSRRSRRCEVDTTAQRSPLKSLNFAGAARSRTRCATRMREAHRRAARASTRSGPTCRWCCTSTADARHAVHRHLGRAAVQARLARGQGRGAAEGNAGRRDARRRRLARPRRATARCYDPCCGSRHDRHRGGADRLRHRARAAAPLRVRAPAAVPARMRGGAGAT